MKSPINHENVEREINEQLRKLRLLPISVKAAAEIGERLANIHSHVFAHGALPSYGPDWIIGLVRASEACTCKGDMIANLEHLTGAEVYNPMGNVNLREMHFMAWDIANSRWQGTCDAGRIGHFAWDLAAIMSEAKDPAFADAFLEGYVGSGGKKPTLLSLYANLYFVQAAEAVRDDEFGRIAEATKDMAERRVFKTDAIFADETMTRLGLIVF